MGISATWEQGGRPARFASRLKPRTGCRKTKIDYFFFFAAFFVFAFFFVAILSLLDGPTDAHPLASSHPNESRRLLGNDSTNLSYTIFSLACTCSFESVVDSLPESDVGNRRHGDRGVSRIERSQHREEIRRRLFEVAANRKVERR